MNERKVLVTPDGLGRIAIVERPDGFFSLYERWHWSIEQQEAFNVRPVRERRWDDGTANPELLYDDRTQPLQGVFDSIERAEAEAQSMFGFVDAVEFKS